MSYASLRYMYWYDMNEIKKKMRNVIVQGQNMSCVSLRCIHQIWYGQQMWSNLNVYVLHGIGNKMK